MSRPFACVLTFRLWTCSLRAQPADDACAEPPKLQGSVSQVWPWIAIGVISTS